MKTQVTKLARLSVDGQGYAGTLKDWKAPDVEKKVETWRGGGMSGDIEVEVGDVLTEMEFTLSEEAPGVCKRFGFVQGANRPFTIRKAIKNDDGQDVAQRFEVGGMIKKIENPTGVAGKLTERKFTIASRSYKEFIDGELIIHIDLEKSICLVNAVDHLAQARANAGL